jgi:hypothetical protein
MSRHLLLPVLAALAALLPGPGAQAADRPTTASCAGAAARDPLHPCAPRSRLSVRPRPEDAILEPNAPCTPLGRIDVLFPCAFGVTQSAVGTVALVGDSHAAHWRAAVSVVAEAEGWSAV